MTNPESPVDARTARVDRIRVTAADSAQYPFSSDMLFLLGEVDRLAAEVASLSGRYDEARVGAEALAEMLALPAVREATWDTQVRGD